MHNSAQQTDDPFSDSSSPLEPANDPASMGASAAGASSSSEPEAASADLSEAGKEASIQAEPSPSKKGSFWESVAGEILQILIMAVVLYFSIDAVFDRVMVLNVSMQPTLYEGDLLLVNKLAYKLGKTHTGDIVIFHNPNFLEEDYVKRLIGNPGDVVAIHHGQVSVNGVILDEPYIADAPVDDSAWTVPQDVVFVMGDNRLHSSDSRAWGFVPLEDLVGKALVVYWPPKAMKVLKHPNYGLPGN